MPRRCFIPWLDLGAKPTWSGLKKIMLWALNIWFGRHKHSWKLSWCLVKNIQWFHTCRCWNAVLDCGHLLSSLLVCSSTAWYRSEVINIAMWTRWDMFCRDVSVVHPQTRMHLWFAETLTANISFWQLGWKSVILLLKPLTKALFVPVNHDSVTVSHQDPEKLMQHIIGFIIDTWSLWPKCQLFLTKQSFQVCVGHDIFLKKNWVLEVFTPR